MSWGSHLEHHGMYIPAGCHVFACAWLLLCYVHHEISLWKNMHNPGEILDLVDPPPGFLSSYVLPNYYIMECFKDIVRATCHCQKSQPPEAY